MRPTLTIAATLAIAATAALAHTGVKDPQVMARMDGMKLMADHTKTLGQMARGRIAFDNTKALAALEGLKSETDRIPELFAPRAADPKSEAKSEIWTDSAGFKASTAQMANALNLADVASPEALAGSMRAIAAACSACHKDYRIEN